MRNRLMIFLLILFTVAAVSLMVVEIAQARSNAVISEDLFNTSVSGAMENVLQQFEEMKPEEYVSEKDRYVASTYRRIDDINNKMASLLREHADLFYDIRRVEMHVTMADSAYPRPKATLTEMELSYLVQYNSILGARTRLIEELNEMKSSKHGKVTENWGMLTRDNFNYLLLDKIVSQELIVKGIDTKPEIGLYCMTTANFLHLSNGCDSADLLSSPYRYTFRLSQMPSANEYCLMLNFPAKFRFVRSANTILVVMSGLLLAVILVIFYISVKTIFKMRSLDEMKNSFISNMTHEIKTPISTIALTCEMLNDPSIQSDEAMRTNFVNTIADENRRMKTLVETILQNSKMTDKNFTMHYKELDFNALTAKVANSFRLRIKNRDGELIEDYEDGLPSIYADEVHVVTMISNLIDNAIKYSVGKPYVKVSTRKEGNNIMLRVEDHGIGIAKEDQEHIFEKFYRVSTGNVHDVKGFGIGLNHVANVVGRHHGKVFLTSEQGKGSTFTIQLPIAEA